MVDYECELYGSTVARTGALRTQLCNRGLMEYENIAYFIYSKTSIL